MAVGSLLDVPNIPIVCGGIDGILRLKVVKRHMEVRIYQNHSEDIRNHNGIFSLIYLIRGFMVVFIKIVRSHVVSIEDKGVPLGIYINF